MMMMMMIIIIKIIQFLFLFPGATAKWPITETPQHINTNAQHTNNSYNRNQQDAIILNFILVKNSTSFGQAYCPSSGV
jgi:hypothetical protein